MKNFLALITIVFFLIPSGFAKNKRDIFSPPKGLKSIDQKTIHIDLSKPWPKINNTNVVEGAEISDVSIEEVKPGILIIKHNGDKIKITYYIFANENQKTELTSSENNEKNVKEETRQFEN